jgi:hypothetical protein
MIRLNLRREPYWIDLAERGVRFRVIPLTSALASSAHSRAQRIIGELKADFERREEAGISTADLPDLEDPDISAGFYSEVFNVSLGRFAIQEWDGVADADGAPAPVSPENIQALMQLPLIGNEFVQAYMKPQELLTTEGNGSKPALNGTTVAGKTTAEPAGETGSPAPSANGSTAPSAPT